MKDLNSSWAEPFINMSKELQEELSEAYEKSLNLAVSLSKTIRKNHDLVLVNQIRKNYQEFKDLQGKHKKNQKSLEYKQSPFVQISSTTKTDNKSPKIKSFLNKSIEESNQNIKFSKAGKSSLKHAEKYPIHNISLSKPLLSNNNPLPHVSLYNGKIENPLNLPGFKEFIQKSSENEDIKNPILEKIEKCEESLKDFERCINGLEVFCNSNPGVPWNNDKKVLYKLYDNPNYKASILRAYNDNLYGNKFRGKSNVSKNSLMQKNNSFSRSSDSSQIINKNPANVTDSKLSPIREIRPATANYRESPENILKRCSDRFIKVKNFENRKLVSIFEKIKQTRPWFLRQKGEFIMHDSEIYKNKLYTLSKFKNMNRKIHSKQEKRLKKNKSQAKIYLEILEHLNKKQNPSDLEVNFTLLIKNILEEG